MKKIGIYGGSFDPIHHGHVSLALEMLEKHSLDSIWFCPSLISPFKQNQKTAAPHHRLNMLKLAIADIPQLHICDIELNRAPPSYTVDTLRILHEEAQTNTEPTQFFLIMGEDSAVSFCDWHEPLEILKFATPLVGTRSEGKIEINCANQDIKKALDRGITPTRVLEISSSEIRQRLQNDKHVEHLLPESVYHYIKQHHLYIDEKLSHNAT